MILARSVTQAGGSSTTVTPKTRFLVIGLPRSGSTYLMSLLNEHPEIFCTGEQFNPYAIVGIGSERISEPKDLMARDIAPLHFLRNFFQNVEAQQTQSVCVGFKYMVGHNVRILRMLHEFPDVRLIYIWRQNKLAQVSSYLKALKSKRWAQTHWDPHVDARINVPVRQLVQHWHEFATYDTLMPSYLEMLPNPVLSFEYGEMFKPGFNARICGFLDVDESDKMHSPLVKQGSNRIIDRFQNAKQVENYFRKTGHANWLEDEL